MDIANAEEFEKIMFVMPPGESGGTMPIVCV